MKIDDVSLSKIAVSLNKSVMHANLHDESVMLNTENNNYFGLDPVGTQMLHLLDTLPSLADVHVQMLEEYDVSAGQLEADIRHLVTELQAEQLVTVQLNR